MRTRSLPPQCQCTEELDISIRNAQYCYFGGMSDSFKDYNSYSAIYVCRMSWHCLLYLWAVELIRVLCKKTACMTSGRPAVNYYTNACFPFPTCLQSKAPFLHLIFRRAPFGTEMLQHFQNTTQRRKIAMQTYCICARFLISIRAMFCLQNSACNILKPHGANELFFPETSL